MTCIWPCHTSYYTTILPTSSCSRYLAWALPLHRAVFRCSLAHPRSSACCCAVLTENKCLLSPPRDERRRGSNLIRRLRLCGGSVVPCCVGSRDNRVRGASQLKSNNHSERVIEKGERKCVHLCRLPGTSFGAGPLRPSFSLAFTSISHLPISFSFSSLRETLVTWPNGTCVASGFSMSLCWIGHRPPPHYATDFWASHISGL